MQYQTEILRFKEGARNRHPSPEATVAAAQPNVLSDAGNQLAVLVDLTPQLPYRSREIRSLVVKTYWTSSGSIVARLRRALAAANRHLISFNQKAQAGNKCAGNITCAVFSNNELFLGQVGAAYAYVSHPPSLQQTNPGAPGFEIFPRRDRLLMPLGSTVPPVIHIAYTVMVPGSIACIATTRVAEALARETWQQTLALAKLGAIANELSRTFASRKISGGAILFSAEASPVSRAAPWARSRPPQLSSKHHTTTTTAASLTPIPSARREGVRGTQQTQQDVSPPQSSRPTVTPVSVSSPESLEETAVARIPQPEMPTGPVSPAQKPAPRKGPRASTAQTTIPEPPAKAPRRPVKLPQLRLPKLTFSLDPLRDWVADAREFWQQRRRARITGVTERTTTAERARLRLALRTLLPGKIGNRQAPTVHTAPTERPSVMGGLAVGFLLIVFLITLTKYLQLGGPLRAETLIADAMDLREIAETSQKADDWYTVHDAAAQILRLDPENAEALALEFEAQQAIDMMENAATLSVTPLLELGTAPSPRRMLIADGWAYVLNTATDAVVAYPLSEDGRALTSQDPVPILKRGQTFIGEVVNHLVDFAWIAPGNNYPDGAVFIYSDGGALFIYEPGVMPGGISVQHIEGDLQPGNITIMDNYGENLYLVHRQLNQILVYQPVNGIYTSPETYFADGAAPDLQLVLDVAIDGRVFLLTGDGAIQSYFTGSIDTAFKMSGLPDTDFTPLVMDIDPDVTDGLIYLVETQKERIIVLDKRGEFIRQYRLPKNELRRIESLRVDQETQVIYLIAENRLYAAPMPNFWDRTAGTAVSYNAMTATLRTFIAIPLSQAVTEALELLQRRLMQACPTRTVRWVPADNIHLTMHFLGDILPERIAPIKEALTEVARTVPPFAFNAGRLGAFPSTNRPRVIWVGISDTTSWLALLHETINESLERLGFQRETRRFSPHLTLGRVQRRASPEDVQNLAKTLSATMIGTLGTVQVETLIFFQSVLKPSGAEYSPLATFRLGKPDV